MSNDKGRDWMGAGHAEIRAWIHDMANWHIVCEVDGNEGEMNRFADAVESIVKKELAEKVEDAFSEMRDHIRQGHQLDEFDIACVENNLWESLLTDKGKEQ